MTSVLRTVVEQGSMSFGSLAEVAGHRRS